MTTLHDRNAVQINSMHHFCKCSVPSIEKRNVTSDDTKSEMYNDVYRLLTIYSCKLSFRCMMRHDIVDEMSSLNTYYTRTHNDMIKFKSCLSFQLLCICLYIFDTEVFPILWNLTH